MILKPLACTDPHVLEAEVLPLVLANQIRSKVLDDFEATCLHRPAAVDSNNEVLLRDADLVAIARVRVALLLAVAIPRHGLGAPAVPTDGARDQPPFLLEAPVASN